MSEYSPSLADTAPTRARLVHDAEGLNSAVWPGSGREAVTPVRSFFTRSHAPIPRIPPDTWRLEVGGLVDRPVSLSLEDLCAVLPLRRVTATLVCAGMRRNEFLALGPLPGELPWGPEPASTGRWSGVALGDLLRLVGFSNRAKYVEMVGLDRVERHGEQFGFGGSIDLAKALSNEVLLAMELNGRPLTPEHGFPLRVVVPGWIGARSVKWLGRITLLEQPSSNYFQSKAYRLQRAVNPRDPRDVSDGTALTEIPLNSVIVEPAPTALVRAGRVRVSGWAIGSGGQAVTAVELSSNGGRDWIAAEIVDNGEQWVWSLWEGTVNLPRGRHTILVRATDSAGTVQPSNVTATWNVKGYNNNAWHRVTLELL